MVSQGAQLKLYKQFTISEALLLYEIANKLIAGGTPMNIVLYCANNVFWFSSFVYN